MKTNPGNFFEDFRLGQRIRHATPRTVTAGDVALYTALYGPRFAVQSANTFAEAIGYPAAPMDDLLTFHVVFGKTVPDISLNAVANLGYAEGRFLRPVWPGDTLSAASEVIGLKENSNGRTGVVWVRTTGRNQRGEAVLEYVRWVMVRKRDAGSPAPAAVVPDLATPAPSADAPSPDTAPDIAAETVPSAPEIASATPPADAASSDTSPAAAGDSEIQPGAADTETSPSASDVAALPEVKPDAEPETAPAPAPETSQPATTAEGSDAEAALPSLLTPDRKQGEKVVDGVTTGRLPSIGGAGTDAPATAAEPDPDTAAAPEDPRLRGFVRSFENPDAKPLFAILLLDSGETEVPRAELAALPFPVTFVLDPLAPGSEAAAQLYREAGQEVIMLASAIPNGAKASDLEQSFAGLEGKLTEAVALIDTAEATFQNDRKLSAEVVNLLRDQRLGLVTFDRGLNAADQVARRENLPAATIFRSLDDDGEDSPLIRRYLDRAAFKAAQEGKVAVIGSARPQTIAALMEWAVEGRASSVALAPITALMAQ